MRVAVIGAGLAGLCTAHSLQRAGFHVTVIERRESPGLETSFANGGVLTPGMSQPWNAPGIHRALLKSLGRSESPVLLRISALPSVAGWGVDFLRQSRSSNYFRNMQNSFRLARYSLKVFDEIAPSLPEAVRLVRTGALKIYRSQESLKFGEMEAAHLAAEGLVSRLLSPRGCVDLEPRLAEIEDRIVGGLHFPDDRLGDAHRFCEMLTLAIRLKGGEFRFDTKVTGWHVNANRVLGVCTNDGNVKADCFVITAGSYSRGLARDLGVDLPIYPVKGYSLSIHAETLSRLPQIPVVDASLHAAIAVIGNCLRIAGTAEFTGFDTQIVPARIVNLESLLCQVYPELAQRSASLARLPWAGLRAMTCDGIPIVGRTDIGNVYVNTGHGHLGWTLAAGSSLLLAQIMSGQPTGLEAFPYSLQRF